MTDKINIGIIGCSTIAKNSTIPAILKSNNTELKYIGSRSNNKAQEFSKIFDCKKYGTYDDVINDEISNHLNSDLDLKKLDKVFQVIIKSAIFEFLYKPKISSKIIINEYLKASNFFIEDGQTKYLNALLDKISKKIRNSNG